MIPCLDNDIHLRLENFDGKKGVRGEIEEKIIEQRGRESAQDISLTESNCVQNSKNKNIT